MVVRSGGRLPLTLLSAVLTSEEVSLGCLPLTVLSAFRASEMHGDKSQGD